jgi:hypothetical protein
MFKGEKMKILIEATLDDLKDGMVKAFENFATKGGLKVDENTKFRCTQIEVSKEVDDYFWKYYTDKAHKDQPELNDEDIKTGIAFLMLQNGAKRNEELEPWTVPMTEDFVINEV